MTRRRPSRQRLAAGVVAAALVLPACGRTAPADPAALLRDAKQRLDGARAVHFRLSSTDVPQTGATLIVGGEGDARRPAAFAGRLDVTFQGVPLRVQVVSVEHTFYIQLPFSSRFETADPTRYAFNDPGVFLDPDHGLSSMLAQARNPSLLDPDRYRGEALEEVRAALPGDLVAGLLTSADPARPRRDVPVTLGIDPDSHQLRRAVLSGLFFDPSHTSTYTLILDRYGEDITISRPV